VGRSEFGSFRHLAQRFFGALLPAGPSPDDEAWARRWLLPGEQRLWSAMSGPDRRHAVGVARRAIALLEGIGVTPPDREVVAAALLHDVGKVEAGLGTFARVGVTLAAMAVGRARLAAAGGAGLRRRVALYLSHDAVGGRLLQQAGSQQFTWAWAEQHHLPAGRWTVDRRLGTALKEADGD
jgi:hypothetical protein